MESRRARLCHSVNCVNSDVNIDVNTGVLFQLLYTLFLGICMLYIICIGLCACPTLF